MTISTASRIVFISGVISFFLSIHNFLIGNPLYATFLLGGIFIARVLYKTPETLLIKKADELNPFLPKIGKDPYYWLGLALMLIPGIIVLVGWLTSASWHNI